MQIDALLISNAGDANCIFYENISGKSTKFNFITKSGFNNLPDQRLYSNETVI